MADQGLAPRTNARFTSVPLTSVPAGAIVTLDEIRLQDSRDSLRSLGLTHASRLRLCKVGDPCIVQVRATRIGLSRAVAQQLYVLVDPDGDREDR